MLVHLLIAKNTKKGGFDMLKIKVPETEMYDELNEEFLIFKEQTLHLEHSLISLSKWESKWLKPFWSKYDKTREESIDYIRCMTINPVNDDIYDRITPSIIAQINKYIDWPMTATTFYRVDKGQNKETITSEIIYYWMITLNIPFECQKWHLNRLLTLINVCDMKNNPSKKMSRKELLNRNRELNKIRREELNTKG